MKIYSYLASGKPVLATNIPAHRAVVSEDSAVLADPNPEAFAAALTRLLLDPHLRRRIGEGGLRLISDGHTYSDFRDTLSAAYDLIGSRVGRRHEAIAAPFGTAANNCEDQKGRRPEQREAAGRCLRNAERR